MNEVSINGELSLAYPDGFHVMDEAEQERVFNEPADKRFGIWDNDRHIIIALTWHESSRFLAKLSNSKDQVKRVESKARKSYKNKGYRFLGFSDTQVAGYKADEIRFEYQIEGIEQTAEVIVFHKDATSYFTYYYARKEDAEESRKVLDEVLSSYRFA